MPEIEEKLIKLHTDDEGNTDDEQLDVIFSRHKRIIVEAPAGYGKTRTMISKIAYLIASNQLYNPKKILALTYSVNAAYKIKRDISKNLPAIFNDSSVSPLTVKNKVLATNYHGLCRKILRLYGYLLNPNLENMENILGIGDSDPRELRRMRIGLNREEISTLMNYNNKLKEYDSKYLKENFNSYLEIVKEKFLPKNYISFNAIILLVLELFNKFPEILRFYRKYFPIIIVDEFQDTTLLSWQLLEQLIRDNTQLIFMGDSLQTIYGFIGAIPEIMDLAKNKYDMNQIDLQRNHRFSNNPKLLTLDKNLRKNAKDIINPKIKSRVLIDVIQANNEKNEAGKILKLTEEILQKHPNEKIIILVRGRWSNTPTILRTFKDFNFFYALFSDENPNYVMFHQKALIEFLDILSNSKGKMNKITCQKFIENIKKSYSVKSQTINSLIKLLIAFLKLVFSEYKFLSLNEKIEFIKDTLENRALKQYLEYVDSNLVISTVHGSKGLEWDYVIIPGIKKRIIPNELLM